MVIIRNDMEESEHDLLVHILHELHFTFPAKERERERERKKEEGLLAVKEKTNVPLTQWASRVFGKRCSLCAVPGTYLSFEASASVWTRTVGCIAQSSPAHLSSPLGGPATNT